GSHQPTLQSIAVGPANPSINVGASQQFTATGTFDDGTQQDITASANWTSSKPNFASISPTGLASGLKGGQVTITAKKGGKTGTATLNVTAVLQSITVTPSNPIVAPGFTQQFAATGNYNDETHQDLTAQAGWSSSDTTVATIDATGLATAIKGG